jgi:hypothetical protein
VDIDVSKEHAASIFRAELCRVRDILGCKESDYLSTREEEGMPV